MPIDESQLGNHPLKGGSVILEDEACPKCDYNLKGLRRGGVCPECGRGISARKRGKRALMIDAPRGYLRGLMLVFLMMGWAGIGAFLIAVVPMIVFSLPILRATGLASVLSVVAMVGALGWVGVVVVGRGAPVPNEAWVHGVEPGGPSVGALDPVDAADVARCVRAGRGWFDDWGRGLGLCRVFVRVRCGSWGSCPQRCGSRDLRTGPTI